MKKLLFVLLVLLSVPATAQNILFAPSIILPKTWTTCEVE